MSRRDFTEPPNIEERIAAAYAALRSWDKPAPTADAVAKLAGVPVDVVEQWLKDQLRP